MDATIENDLAAAAEAKRFAQRDYNNKTVTYATLHS